MTHHCYVGGGGLSQVRVKLRNASARRLVVHSLVRQHPVSQPRCQSTMPTYAVAAQSRVIRLMSNKSLADGELHLPFFTQLIISYNLYVTQGLK